MPDENKYIKVLSIDGGGIRGLIPAMVLAEIERKTGDKIANMFDLMTGNSAGGIATLGLNVADQNRKPRFSAEKITEFFTKDGPVVFKKSPWKRVTSGFGILDEKYDHKPLVRVLKKYLGQNILETSVTRSLISTYDIYNRHPQFFKSWDKKYNKHNMWEIARATSAAPTYFEPIKLVVNEKKAVLVD